MSQDQPTRTIRVQRIDGHMLTVELPVKRPYTWACETCRDEGWIDQRIGGAATSGWAVCPDCGNPHGGMHP